MLTRLANVVFALGLMLAALFCIFAVAALFSRGEEKTALLFAPMGLIFFGIGWAFRYVITGRTKAF